MLRNCVRMAIEWGWGRMYRQPEKLMILAAEYGPCMPLLGSLNSGDVGGKENPPTTFFRG